MKVIGLRSQEGLGRGERRKRPARPENVSLICHWYIFLSPSLCSFLCSILLRTGKEEKGKSYYGRKAPWKVAGICQTAKGSRENHVM